MDYKWLQKICDDCRFYDERTDGIKSVSMPDGSKFTLATNGHILMAYEIESDYPPFPEKGKDSLIKMLTRQEGQAVSFADLCKWVEVERCHDCPFCGGTGKRESNRIDEEDGTPLEVYQWPLGGILCGQSIDRRLLHLPFNHLQAETITIAALSDLKRDEYHPVQIHCAEWILCVMPMSLTEEDTKGVPSFPAHLSCAP